MNGGDAESSQPFLAFTEESQASTPVFQLLHHIKQDVEVCSHYSRSNWASLCWGPQETIDSSLTWEQLTASDVNFSIVRPLVHKVSTSVRLASLQKLIQIHLVCHFEQSRSRCVNDCVALCDAPSTSGSLRLLRRAGPLPRRIRR